MAIIEAAGYEVDLTTEPPTVQVVKHRKALGYSYAEGGSTYRSTIKVGSANWKRAVKEARGNAEKAKISEADVDAYIARVAAADAACPPE